MSKRDYSPFGPDAKRAVESGLTAAEWYHTEVPRKVMKELMARSDQPAIRDTIIWALRQHDPARRVSASRSGPRGGASAVLRWLRRALRLGERFALARMRPWHRLQDAWMNDVVYQIASFMLMRNPVHLALEPCAPPHRHDHRRPRRRDRGDAPAGPGAS
jgi:hypothetical protein